LPIAQPKLVDPVTSLGGDNLESRSPFAVRYRYYQTYEVSPAHACLAYYRNEFENLLENNMNWLSYDSIWDLLLTPIHTDKPYWRARVPMIHFWMVCDVSLLKFIIPRLILRFGCKRTAYVGIVRGRSTRKEVIPKFIPLGYLDVQVSKGGLFRLYWLKTEKTEKKQ
jgi:hypothetical protein